MSVKGIKGIILDIWLIKLTIKLSFLADSFKEFDLHFKKTIALDNQGIF